MTARRAFTEAEKLDQVVELLDAIKDAMATDRLALIPAFRLVALPFLERQRRLDRTFDPKHWIRLAPGGHSNVPLATDHPGYNLGICTRSLDGETLQLWFEMQGTRGPVYTFDLYDLRLGPA